PRGGHQEDGVANGGKQQARRNGALIGRRRSILYRICLYIPSAHSFPSFSSWQRKRAKRSVFFS
uniref:Uncharacterized protein n=1 Tax=Aegilops tauschii subsp. strangulata TaxID=200361 RepID=A0A453CAW3_AEGTS